MKDISDNFSLDRVDHYELLKLFELRYKTTWRTSDSEIAFPAHARCMLSVRLEQGTISQILRGPALTKVELQGLLEQIVCELRDDRVGCYGVAILRASRPVNGSFVSSSGRLQVLPPPIDAPRAPQMNAEHPFVLEYPIRAAQSPEFRFGRRYRGSVEWAWFLNAVLIGSVNYDGSRPRQMWATKSGEAPGGCFWAQEFYFVDGHAGFAKNYSIAGPQLRVIPAATYYADWGVRAKAQVPTEELVIPGNLDDLVEAFTSLSSTARRQFLRAAAAIHYARAFWDISITHHTLACIQAIEALVDKPPPKRLLWLWRKRGPGPMRLFREFCCRHAEELILDKKELNNVYEVRSNLVHGRYLFQLDEAPWATGLAPSIASLREQDAAGTAITLAKAVLRGWLLSKGAAAK